MDMVLVSVADLRAIIREEIAYMLQSVQKPKDDRLLTIKEAIAILKVSRQTMSEWTRRGKLNVVKIGSRIRYRECELMKFIENSSPPKLTDGYVRGILKKNGTNNPKREVIELKRDMIKYHRAIKKLKQKSKSK